MVTIARKSEAPAPAGTVPVTVRQLVPVFVWAVVFTVFLFFLGAWKLCLLGLLAALCLAALLRPLMVWLPGPRALKGILLGLVPLAACVGLVIGAVSMLVGEIRRQLQYLPDAEKALNSWLAGASQRLGLHQQITVGSVLSKAGGSALPGISHAVLDLGIGFVFVFVGTIYLLAEPSEDVIPPLLRMLPCRRQQQARSAISALEPRLRWWLIGALITATAIGLTSLTGFWLIGLKLWLPLAILAGLSEFIPTLGPLMAFMVALAIAATQSSSKVIWLCGLYTVVHILESYILIPLVYKEAVRVPPIITLFTVVLWGEIFGIGGLLLAIPINLFLWTLAEHFVSGEVPLPPGTDR